MTRSALMAPLRSRGAIRSWLATLVILSLYLVVVNACCPNACSGQGICTNNANGCICKCFKGYTAGDCSQRLCPMGTAWSDMPIATDRAHQPTICSGRGQCDLTTGKCNCDAGFTGLSCNRLACPNDCSKHGDCRSLKFHAFRKDKGIGSPVRYDGVWDSDMIYGCVCDDGYEGGDCSKRVCATGDDPLTGAATDTIFGVQKNEKQSVLCTATGGTFTLSFRGQTTVPISATDSADIMSQKVNALTTLRSVNVLYGGSTSTTACTADGNSATLEFTQNFNSLPLVVGDGTKLTHAGVGSVPRLVISKSEPGTKENDVCSNRGRCDQTSGVCNCYNGFTTSGGNGRFGDRGDCGAAETTITSCPGEIACSGHGYCSGSPQFRCFCTDGWTSGDCSVRTCPQGKAWFDLPIADNQAHQLATCSGVGVCDIAKGECSCPLPFEGAACERMKCPGNDQPCSGNGRCLLMSQMALEARVNGEPIAVTYGRTPNLARTWDYNKVQVCLCDDGFGGHDCSLRQCPKGDDPRTTGQQQELQTILCVHTQVSSFQLSFRGQVSGVIPSDASRATLKAALEAMSNIQSVDVIYSSGTTACTLALAATNTISIRFRQALGDVPPLRFVPGANAAYFSTFTIDMDGVGISIRGTVENVECSNNGICNHGTGRCTCFEGMASSNGANQVGLRGDCGFILPSEDPLARNLQIQA